METWTEVARVRPRPNLYRVRCTDNGCDMRIAPCPTRDTAETTARGHADATQHVVVIEACGVRA